MQEETMAISGEDNGTAYEAGTAMRETINYGSTPKNQIATQRQRLRFGKEEQPSGRISAQKTTERNPTKWLREERRSDEASGCRRFAPAEQSGVRDDEAEQSAVCDDADAGTSDESLPCAKGGAERSEAEGLYGRTRYGAGSAGGRLPPLRQPLSHGKAVTAPLTQGSHDLIQGSHENGADDNRARFRELIGGEYKQAFADEVQRIIDRRFRETKMLKQRLAELEGKAEKTDTVQGRNDGRQVAAPTGAAEQRAACIDDAAPTGAEGNASPVQGEVLSEAKRKGCTVGRDAVLDGGVQSLSQPAADSSLYTREPLGAAEQRAACIDDAAPTGAAVDLLYAILENDAADQQVRLTAERLKNDVDALRGKYPNLDPDTLLESDNAMRAYLSGASAEDLLWAMHHDRLLADAQSAVVESIRARQERPVENGASGGAAFTVRKDFSKMSLDELEAYGKH